MKRLFFQRFFTLFLMVFLVAVRLQAQLPGISSGPANCVLPEALERGFGRHFARWDSQIIPYRFGSKMDEQTIDNFMSVIDSFMANTNLCFIPAFDEYDILTVDITDRPYYYFDSYKSIFVGRGCVACPHELGHALGLAHEQQRPDRDSFVTVFYQHIDPAFWYAYDILDSENYSDYSFTPVYDYKSMMHYSHSAFGINTDTAMVRKDGSIDFGSYYPSVLDYQKLNDLYTEKVDCAALLQSRPPLAHFVYYEQSALCEGTAVEAINLTAAADATYEWQINGAIPAFSTEKNPVISFPKPGDYYINLKASNAYGSSSSFKLIHIDDCNNPVLFDYWANPTSGKMTLLFNRVQPKNIVAIVYNVAGQPVYHTTVTPGDTFPSLVGFDFPDGIVSGVYFLSLQLEDQMQMIKVVLQR